MLVISSATEIGARQSQEDRYVVNRSLSAGTLLAVIDGHGGDTVAQVCEDYLLPFWQLAAFPAPDGTMRDPLKALDLTLWQLSSITEEYQSGACISVAYIPADEEEIHVATLGDCPVIVHTPDGRVQCAASHNVRENLVERAAAEARGGFYSGGYIWNGSGDYSMGLQMSRSLGDGYMGPVLSRQADLATYKLGDFALLSSDGLFDPAHADPAAMSVIGMLISNGEDAQALVNYAVNLPTGDNVTAILVRRINNGKVTQ
jgi:serine/threonine protein phosphatase PrpC